MATPISEIHALDAMSTVLEALGYTTLEEIVSISEVAGRELAEYLQIPSMDSLMAGIPVSAESVPAESLATFRTSVYTLGLDVESIPQRYAMGDTRCVS